MICSFADDETRLVFEGKTVRRLPPDIHRTAQRKLLLIHAANRLHDLKTPPNNKLERLDKERSRKGQWSIRVNDKWRICFEWADGNAHRVELTDYH